MTMAFEYTNAKSDQILIDKYSLYDFKLISHINTCLHVTFVNAMADR